MAVSPPAQRAIVKLAQDILNSQDAPNDAAALTIIEALLKRWNTHTRVRLRRAHERQRKTRAQ